MMRVWKSLCNCMLEVSVFRRILVSRGKQISASWGCLSGITTRLGKVRPTNTSDGLKTAGFRTCG